MELENGESWFLHFQDKDAYGRIVHLQPVAWENDWPRIGEPGADGVGTPVLRFRKPAAGVGSPVAAPAATDEFAAGRPGLQWQWQANPLPEWTPPGPAGGLRLRAMPLPEGAATLYDAPHLLLQKFPAPAFEATVEMDVAALKPGDEAGLVVFGFRHARLAAGRARSGDRFLAYTEGDPADERVLWRMPLTDERIGLRLSVAEGAVCRFAYRSAGEPFRPVDAGPFEAAPGRWVGAKVGLFAAGADGDAGYAAFGPFRVTP
ncbi:hypothetical protein [Cohnella algarum]|uniref:beta-xylosidase family glycoside hydrolase n=1 Tax=Cohnella algarum TaxID=2044859 RepID=UPI00308441E1